jgi:hypothetical protein
MVFWALGVFGRRADRQRVVAPAAQVAVYEGAAMSYFLTPVLFIWSPYRSKNKI